MKFSSSKGGYIFFFITICLNINSPAQNTSILKLNGAVKDTLSFKTIMDSVLKNNPLINELVENINGAQIKIDLSKTAYLPNIEASGMFSRMSPNTKIDLPFGSFQLYPDNSLDAHIGVNQMIYDFGKAKTNVSLQQSNKEISEITVEQAKQKLSIATAIYFYSLLYLQEAEKIKKDQWNTLKKHLEFIEKKLETGSAIKYEIVSTKVKISIVENQLTEIESSKELQVVHLNILLGKPGYSFAVNGDLKFNYNFQPVDSLYKAMQNRQEIVIAKKKEEAAQWSIEYSKAQNRPVISLAANAGFKNGYLPNIEKLLPNYFVGAGIKIPIFDANRTRLNVKLQTSGLQVSKYETENTNRTVMNEVSENYSNLLVSHKKIDQFALQLEQAEIAYSLAETNFKLGTVTNLDLLDAATTMAESKLLLLRANIDQQINLLKLNASIGKRIF